MGISCLLSVWLALLSAPTEYRLVPEKSLVYVQVQKDRTTSLQKLAHDHVVRASQFSGNITFDEIVPAQCLISFEAPVSGLRVDEDDLRSKVGYDQKIDDADRKRIAGNMRDEGQLSADAYPFIRIKGSNCTKVDDTNYKVRLTLNVHGTEKVMETTVHTTFAETSVTADGKLTTTHEDFDMKPYKAFLGAVGNATEMKFTFSLHAERVQP